MRLPVPDLRDLVTAVPRLLALLAQAEEALAQVGQLLARIEETRRGADVVVARTDATVERADALLDSLEPSLTRLQPTLERLAETTDPHEVDAMVQLIDTLPRLSTQMEQNVLPVLTTLDSVAPDLHDLLDVSRELNEMLTQVPGLSRMKRRIDKVQEERGRG